MGGREFGMDMYILLYLKWVTNKDLRKLCSILCGSLDGRGVWGRMDTRICIAELPCCSHKISTTLLIDYTPIQNKKLKDSKKIVNCCLNALRKPEQFQSWLMVLIFCFHHMASTSLSLSFLSS